ncbi:MAG: orotidine-5'-phosphate decarboxylase [Anaerolineae bacterium]
MNFWRKLEASIELHDSLLCVGLDPVCELFPAHCSSIYDFGKAIVDATHDLVCCYKPNIAFYEVLGSQGIDALQKTLEYIPDSIPVILDAKRNDIANTAGAYAKAAFEVVGADAITVNPYLGGDSIQPFLDYADKGVFILCKTSNPSAGEIQDWARGGEPLYRHVADLSRSWAGEREIGLVIGATYPEAIADIRVHAPNTWFLIPGIGTQGGELAPILEGGLRADGFGLIINASRGVIYAESPREAAVTLRAQINTLRDKTLAVMRDRSHNPTVREIELDRLARSLYEAKCVQFGDCWSRTPSC